MSVARTLQPHAPHSEPSQDHNQNPTGIHKGAVHVLLAEDQIHSADMERTFLQGLGFQVEVAATPKEVVSMVLKKSYDLFMVDLNFYRKKGLDLVGVVRQESRNRGIKILVRSVVSHPSLKKQCAAAGAHSFVVMPAPRPALIQEIKKLLDDVARTNERVPEKLEVSLQVGVGHIHGYTLDLSSDGAHIGFPHGVPSLLPCGTPVQVNIKLKTPKGTEINPQGEVVRHTPEGIGIRFTAVSKAHQKRLNEYLSSMSFEQRASAYYLGGK